MIKCHLVPQPMCGLCSCPYFQVSTLTGSTAHIYIMVQLSSKVINKHNYFTSNKINMKHVSVLCITFKHMQCTQPRVLLRSFSYHFRFPEHQEPILGKYVHNTTYKHQNFGLLQALAVPSSYSFCSNNSETHYGVQHFSNSNSVKLHVETFYQILKR